MTKAEAEARKRAHEILGYGAVDCAEPYHTRAYCEKLTRELLLLNTDLAAARAENRCDACEDTGTPASGLPCMCQGTGKMSVAAVTLRSDLVNADRRYAKLEAENAVLRERLERAETMLRRWMTYLNEAEGDAPEEETEAALLPAGAVSVCGQPCGICATPCTGRRYHEARDHRCGAHGFASPAGEAGGRRR